MRTIMAVACLGLVASTAAVLSAESQQDAVLAEMKKCEVCKEMATKPELMSQMSWETHKIDNGMLCVASVPSESRKDFIAMHEKMMKRVEKVKADSQAGKEVKLCTFCEGMGSLDKAGAKHETIHTATGVVSLVTSKDPQVVEKIHKHADEAIAMEKKLQQGK